jgi:hypothetical protein
MGSIINIIILAAGIFIGWHARRLKDKPKFWDKKE